MFRTVLALHFFFSSILFAQEIQKPVLVVSTYDSMVSKGGLGAEIFPIFESKCGCRLKVMTSGDGVQVLSRLELDLKRGKSQAQVLLGIDQTLWERARANAESWGKWRPQGYERLEAQTQVEEGFLPYDYGVLALISDTEALRDRKLLAPHSLKDLADPKWKKAFILEDPRTSTPGLGFFLYSESVLGSADQFWKSLKNQWLALAPGWDQAYGLFLKKEAPLVWSYTTSQAYHEENGDRAHRYRAALFEEGQPVQVEGAAWVKGSLKSETDRKLAREFFDFLISPEVQAKIPLHNWMLPARAGVPLPGSFQNLPKPKKLVRTETDRKKIQEALARWSRAVEGGS